MSIEDMPVVRGPSTAEGDFGAAHLPLCRQDDVQDRVPTVVVLADLRDLGLKFLDEGPPAPGPATSDRGHLVFEAGGRGPSPYVRLWPTGTGGAGPPATLIDGARAASRSCWMRSRTARRGSRSRRRKTDVEALQTRRPEKGGRRRDEAEV